MAGLHAVLWFAVLLGPGDPPLVDAAMRGDLEAVVALLKGGADVNAPQGDGMTALHWAAERGDAAMTTALVYAGANLEAVTRLGDYTPLHLAAKAGRAEVGAVLLKAGSDANAASTAGGATALHFAAAAGSAGLVQALLDHGADVNTREASWGQTPLMFAAAFGRLDTVRALLARGADVALATTVVDIPTRQREDQAFRSRRNKVLAAFRAESGAEAARGPSPTQVQAAMRTARQTQPEKPAEAEEEKVDYEEASPQPLSYTQQVGKQGGLTALLHAAREGHTAVALTVLDAGADIDRTGGDGTSPLLMAMINGHFDLGLILLERGADPSLANDSGSTPLYAALNTHWHPKARYPQQMAYLQQEASYLDVMETLLGAGVDPNVQLKKHLWYMSYTFDLLSVDTTGATPFWRAAYATDVAAMRLLIANGADPSAPTINLRSGRRGRGRRTNPDADNPRQAEAAEPTTPPLDPSGLPPVPVGGPGIYPIHAASGVGYGQGYAGNAHRHAPEGWLPSVRYLVEELGADVNARDQNGYSALHHAAARGDNDLILYLVEQGADPTVLSRRGQSTADMANGPTQRLQIFPETVALLQRLGSKVTPKD